MKNNTCKRCGEIYTIPKEHKGSFICPQCYTNEKYEECVHFFSSKRDLFPSPKDIKDSVEKIVMGQETALKQLSTELYKHILRCSTVEIEDVRPNIKKNNILMCGPTASGKTFMVEELAKILDIPFVSVDITSITPEGYAGGNIEDIFKKLLIKTDNSYIAQRGIVFLDEIDKIVQKETPQSPDIKGRLMQEALLRTIEGTTMQIKIGNEIRLFDTSNILFVCAGAFVGIEDIVEKRLNGNKKIGFSFDESNNKEDKKDKDYYRSLVNEKDFLEFGFIPEFMGRIPVKLTLNKLKLEDVKKTLLSKNGIISEYVEIFKLEGRKLLFEEKAIDMLANIILSSDIGMRSMRSVMAALTNDILFDLIYSPSKKVKITCDLVKKHLSIKYSKELESINTEKTILINKSNLGTENVKEVRV